MKKTYSHIFFTCLLLFPPAYCFSQSPSWLWVRSSGGINYDANYSIATDDSGNVYITGVFSSDSIIFGPYTLTNAGSSTDVIIVKYDGSGSVLWAKKAGGWSNDDGTSIATDGSGNVYVTGWFSSDSISFGSYTLTNAGLNDFFIVKYDGSGNVLWAKSVGGYNSIGYDSGTSITTDSSGNVFVTGVFSSDSIIFGSDTLINEGGGGNPNDIFIVKYDGNGNVLWAKSAGGTKHDYVRNIAAVSSGNVYITGSFQSSSIIFGSDTLVNAGGNCGGGCDDIFVVKFDGNGNVLWSKRVGETYWDYGTGIAADSSGNMYVTGYFLSSSITFGSYTLINAGGNCGGVCSDIFIAKYDGSGNVIWAKSAGETSYDYANSIATDSSGNVYLTGAFGSPSISFDSYTITNEGGSLDIFTVKYDIDGNVLWAKSAGGTNNEGSQSIVTDGSGNVYIAGSFWSDFIFFDTYMLINAGYYDIFVAKLSGVGTVIDETSLEERMSMFPNPTKDEVILQIINSNKFTDCRVEISDITGRKIKQIPLLQNNTKINTAEYESGIYFLAIYSGSNIIVGSTEKLLIIR